MDEVQQHTENIGEDQGLWQEYPTMDEGNFKLNETEQSSRILLNVHVVKKAKKED